ncbi:DUF5666 domain-containing protein [Halofilum ochraceum]|uniref:DUF5666 domain-containing protein n=1 Tax=Halofilum ochraceum TaxID=1611323 RepID=UPI0008D99B69|nr:DUF5666 domain-containing protein [Halofilum ochraceum]
MTQRALQILTALLIALLLGGCGGGSSGDTVADSDPGGIGGTGISSGSISAIGSIVVNGRRFDVESAEIAVNGTPKTQSALEVGYVVDVRGDFDDGVAESVEFIPDLVGPITGTSIPAGTDTGTLAVMGQVVQVTPTTLFTNGASADGLTEGDRVLVSGFRNSGREIVASHIRLRPGSGDFPEDQIVGRATSVSPDGFEIAGLRIDTAFPPDAGERVVATGMYQSRPSPRFEADDVAAMDDLRAEPDDAVELEGIVEAFDTLSSPFTVDGVTVDGSGATVEGGDIGLDAEVEVDGSFNRDGVLIARRIEVDREENVEIEARVSDVSSDLTSVRFFNGALSVRITDRTRLKDDSGGIDAFGVGDIAPGNYLEIDGYVANGGASVVATRLEREDPEDQAVIEGPVQSFDAANQSITLLGITVRIDEAVIEDGPISDLPEGTIVEITWNQAAPDLSESADEVEIEEPDD